MLHGAVATAVAAAAVDSTGLLSPSLRLPPESVVAVSLGCWRGKLPIYRFECCCLLSTGSGEFGDISSNSSFKCSMLALLCLMNDSYAKRFLFTGIVISSSSTSSRLDDKSSCFLLGLLVTISAMSSKLLTYGAMFSRSSSLTSSSMETWLRDSASLNNSYADDALSFWLWLLYYCY